MLSVGRLEREIAGRGVAADGRHLRHARHRRAESPRRSRRRSTCASPRARPPACARTAPPRRRPAASGPSPAPSPSRSSPCPRRTVRTRTSGLPMRIFSRRSFCSPVITPMMTISALTADRHAADRDQADERQQLRPAPAAQVPPGESTSSRRAVIPGAASERGSRRGCSACSSDT